MFYSLFVQRRLIARFLTLANGAVMDVLDRIRQNVPLQRFFFFFFLSRPDLALKTKVSQSWGKTGHLLACAASNKSRHVL